MEIEEQEQERKCRANKTGVKKKKVAPVSKKSSKQQSVKTSDADFWKLKFVEMEELIAKDAQKALALAQGYFDLAVKAYYSLIEKKALLVFLKREDGSFEEHPYCDKAADSLFYGLFWTMRKVCQHALEGQPEMISSVWFVSYDLVDTINKIYQKHPDCLKKLAKHRMFMPVFCDRDGHLSHDSSYVPKGINLGKELPYRSAGKASSVIAYVLSSIDLKVETMKFYGNTYDPTSGKVWLKKKGFYKPQEMACYRLEPLTEENYLEWWDKVVEDRVDRYLARHFPKEGRAKLKGHCKDALRVEARRQDKRRKTVT